MAELRVKEWKGLTAQVKRGNSLLGELHRADGKIIFWTKRLPDDVVTDKDAWALEAELYSLLKNYRVGFIGIKVANGDVYMTRATSFEDSAKGAQMAVVTRGRRPLRVRLLPRSAFAQKLAEPEGTIDLMRIKGRR
jgi:hypothetical protein